MVNMGFWSWYRIMRIIAINSKRSLYRCQLVTHAKCNCQIYSCRTIFFTNYIYLGRMFSARFAWQLTFSAGTLPEIAKKMTPKQQERILTKILKLKKALSDDKKYWGGYHRDARGYRYIIPELYLKIEDYKGASRYFNWFFKTFEGDISNPILMFEYCVTLYQTNKIQKAENLALF